MSFSALTVLLPSFVILCPLFIFFIRLLDLAIDFYWREVENANTSFSAKSFSLGFSNIFLDTVLCDVSS